MANISLANYHTVKNNKSGGNYSLRNAVINGYNEGDAGFTFTRENLVSIGTSNASMTNLWGGSSENYYTYPLATDASLRFKFDPCNSVTTGTYMGLYDTYDDPSTSFPGLDGSGSSMEVEGVTANPSYTRITGPVGGAQAGLTFNGSTQRCRFPTVSSNTSYTANNSNNACWVGWVYFNESQPASFKYAWTNNQQIGSTVNYYGAFLQQSSAGAGIIAMLHGDGTGTASSDRRSYVTGANTVGTGWHFVVLQIAGNTTSFNSAGTNRIWTSDTNAFSSTDRISTRTGTGGNLAYNTAYRYCLGQFSNGGYFNGSFGHQWWFTNHISAGEAESLWQATYQLYQ